MIMKKITWFSALTAICAVAVGVSGCTKKELEIPAGEKSQLLLTGKTQQMGVTKAQKATTTQPLANNFETGIYVVNRTSGENVGTAGVSNLKHVSDASGALINTGAPIILTTGWEYDMIAYGPHDPAVVAANGVKVTHGNDMIWAKSAGEKPNAKTHSTALTFQHKVSQIEFELVDGGTTGEGNSVNLAGATFKVTGFVKDGTVDLTTGAMTLGAVDPTIVLTGINNTDLKTDVIYFVPGENLQLNAEVTLADGTTFSGVYKKKFEAGRHYQVKIKVLDLDTDLDLDDSTLLPWEEDEEGDLELGQ